MLEQIVRVMNPLPPAKTRKKPWLAFVLLFSGIALGPLFWVGAVIGGLWGLLRAVNSNERLGRAR